MIDIQALNTLLVSISVVLTVVVATAISAIVLVWAAERGRHAQQVASGVRAVEEHLAAAARDHADH